MYVKATDLNRRGGIILDVVEAGETIVVIRRNVPCAIISKFDPEKGNEIDWRPLFEKEEDK